MKSCCFFLGVLLCGNILYCVFFLVFLVLLWLCPFFKNQIVFSLGFSFDFLVSYYFFLRLGNRLQKNKLSSFKLV